MRHFCTMPETPVKHTPPTQSLFPHAISNKKCGRLAWHTSKHDSESRSKSSAFRTTLRWLQCFPFSCYLCSESMYAGHVPKHGSAPGPAQGQCSQAPSHPFPTHFLASGIIKEGVIESHVGYLCSWRGPWGFFLSSLRPLHAFRMALRGIRKGKE